MYSYLPKSDSVEPKKRGAPYKYYAHRTESSILHFTLFYFFKLVAKVSRYYFISIAIFCRIAMTSG